MRKSLPAICGEGVLGSRSRQPHASRAVRRLAGCWLAALIVGICLLAWSGCRSGSAELGGGVRYRHIVDDVGPLSIHVLEIEHGRSDLTLSASVGEAVKGKETVPEMVSALPPSQGRALAAVNGDYFEFRGEPRFYGALQGLCIIDGELVSGPAGYAFCVNRFGRPSVRKARARFEVAWPDASTSRFGLNCSTADYKSEVGAAPIVLFTPRFGQRTGAGGGVELVLTPVAGSVWLPLRTDGEYKARVREVTRSGNTRIPPDGMVLSISTKAESEVGPVRVGDTLRIRTTVDGDMRDVVTAVGGGPALLANGDILPRAPGNPEHRAPRTAVGMDDRRLFVVVVDGRQKNLSIGMHHRQLAEFMHSLGCTDALNLDGGGSSTFWLAGRVVNSPSGGRLRAVGNCLVLSRAPAPTPSVGSGRRLPRRPGEGGGRRGRRRGSWGR